VYLIIEHSNSECQSRSNRTNSLHAGFFIFLKDFEINSFIRNQFNWRRTRSLTLTKHWSTLH